jgi:hypothetical protein
MNETGISGSDPEEDNDYEFENDEEIGEDGKPSRKRRSKHDNS